MQNHNSSSIRIALITLAILIFADAASIAHCNDRRPNIVFILADDLGYGDLGCYGSPDTATPQLDRLAQEGVRFTDHYANSSECTPTRAAFLTGRYPQRIGGLECAIGAGNVGRYDDAIRLRETHDLGLPDEEQTISKLLQQSGYETAIVGKWHLGYEPKFAPSRHGFDQSFYCLGGLMDYFHYVEPDGQYQLCRDDEEVQAEGYFTDLVTNEAVYFLRKQRDRPFFLYVPYTTPHSPFQGPGDLQLNPLPADSPLWNQSLAPHDVYVAMIESLDQGVGRILQALQDQGLTENTVVIFASDNGGTLSARNGPLSGTKGTTFEGGIRVPAIVRWPGTVPAGLESSQPCITFDFTASIAKIANVDPKTEQPFEGIDIVTHVAEQKPDFDRTLYWRKQRGTEVWQGVREANLKMVRRETGEELEEHLFDLAADSSESYDLKTNRSEDYLRLKEKYFRWEQEVRKNRRGKPE